MTTQLGLPGTVLISTCGLCVIVSSAFAHSRNSPSGMIKYVLPSNKALLRRPFPLPSLPWGFCSHVGVQMPCVCLGGGIVMLMLALSLSKWLGAQDSWDTAAAQTLPGGSSPLLSQSKFCFPFKLCSFSGLGFPCPPRRESGCPPPLASHLNPGLVSVSGYGGACPWCQCQGMVGPSGCIHGIFSEFSYFQSPIRCPSVDSIFLLPLTVSITSLALSSLCTPLWVFSFLSISHFPLWGTFPNPAHSHCSSELQ